MQLKEQAAGQPRPLRGAIRHLQGPGGVVQALPADLHGGGQRQSRHPHILLQVFTPLAVTVISS